jgi:hypothetical protein
VTGSTTTAENINHYPYSGKSKRVVGGLTGSTTNAENVDCCPYSGISSGVASDVTGSTTTAENIDHCPYFSVWRGHVMGRVVLQVLKTLITVHTLVYRVGWQVM